MVFDPKLVSYEQLLRVFWEEPRPDPGLPPGQRRRDAIPLRDLRPRSASSGQRPRRRATAYASELATGGLRRRSRPRSARPAGVLLRGGVPPAVPGQEPGRLLPEPLDRREAAGRLQGHAAAVRGLTDRSAGGVLARQVAVLHLPGVVEHVIGGVAEQVGDRPVAERLDLLRTTHAWRRRSGRGDGESVTASASPPARTWPSHASRSRHPRCTGHAGRPVARAAAAPGTRAGAPPRRGRPSRRTRPTPRAAAGPGGRRWARRMARDRAVRGRRRCPRSRSSRPRGSGRRSAGSVWLGNSESSLARLATGR